MVQSDGLNIGRYMQITSVCRALETFTCYLSVRSGNNSVFLEVTNIVLSLKAAVSAMCNPPRPGDESYETFIKVSHGCNFTVKRNPLNIGPRILLKSFRKYPPPPRTVSLVLQAILLSTAMQPIQKKDKISLGLIFIYLFIYLFFYKNHIF